MTTTKEFYEKIIVFLEDFIDINIVETTDFGQGENFEKIIRKLGL